MPAYAEMAGRPWLETLPRCTLAALGDVAIRRVLLASLAYSWTIGPRDLGYCCMRRLQGTSPRTGCSAHRCDIFPWFLSVRTLSVQRLTVRPPVVAFPLP